MTLPLGILYEHPEWFRPLFAEIERRGLPFQRLDASEHLFNPASAAPDLSLVVNRMSPSAYLRGHGAAINYTRDLLEYLEAHDLPLVNGSKAFALERSKARQALLFERLGLPYPRTRVVHRPEQIETAVVGLEYPLMIKPNLGGSGALMQRFEQPEDLRAALSEGQIDLGPDGLGLVQEYHPPRDGAIVRVEVLDGRYLYAIRIPTDPNQGFNLCPADICQTPEDAEAATGAACPSVASGVEGFQPPNDVIEAVLSIMAAGPYDVCGVEYLESERDGQRYFYDINALSNFVVDAPRVVGFDPFVPFVDYLERRSLEAREVEPALATR